MKTTDPHVILRADMLLAFEPFQGREEVRKYLWGTNIVPHEKGAVLTATDGAALAALLDDNAFAEGPEAIWHVPAKSLKPILLTASRWGSRNVWVDLTPTEVAVWQAEAWQEIAEHSESAVRLGSLGGNHRITGPFPEWERVVPLAAKWKPLGANPPYIRGDLIEKAVAFSVAMEKVSSVTRYQVKSSGGIQMLATDGENGPVRVFSRAFREAIVILMPMSGAITPADPAWFVEMVSPPKEKPEKMAA